MRNVVVLEPEPTEEEYFEAYNKHNTISSSWFVLVFILRCFPPFCLGLQVGPFEHHKSVEYYIDEFKLYGTVTDGDHVPGNFTVAGKSNLSKEIIVQMMLLRCLGFALGAIFGGIACDIFGRRLTSTILSVVWISAGTIFIMLQNQQMVMIFYVFLTACSSAVNVITFVNFSEIASVKYRVLVIYTTLFYVVADFILAYIAEYLEDWKYFLTFITSTISCVIFATWYVPESPRWLLAANKKAEAYEQLNEISGRIFDIPHLEAAEYIPKTKIAKEMFKFLFLHRLKYFAICNLLIGVASIHYGCSKLLVILEQVNVPDYDKFDNGAELLGFLSFIPIHILFGKRYGLFFCFILLAVENIIAMALCTQQSAVYFHLFATMAGLTAVNFCWLYFLNIFPTFLRGTAIGFGFCVFNITIGVTTFIVIKKPEFSRFYYHLGSCLISLFGTTVLLLPATNDLPNSKPN